MIDELKPKEVKTSNGKAMMWIPSETAEKVNELIEASNEQANRIEIIEKNVAVLADNIRDNYKKIDFIMENTNSNETESVDDSINIRHTNRTLKQLYEK